MTKKEKKRPSFHSSLLANTTEKQYVWQSIMSWLGLPGGSVVKNLPMQMWVQSLGWEGPLEKEMATHSNILAWETPWTEGPGGLQSMGLQRVGHDWATKNIDVLWNYFFPCSLSLFLLKFTLLQCPNLVRLFLAVSLELKAMLACGGCSINICNMNENPSNIIPLYPWTRSLRA